MKVGERDYTTSVEPGLTGHTIHHLRFKGFASKSTTFILYFPLGKKREYITGLLSRCLARDGSPIKLAILQHKINIGTKVMQRGR